ncbi:hypothetical protein LTR15_003195 [Elasticomyces elasticus]|nr:hypothetical protein LTR15_003195 [Elasticomyces elasticus]
MLDSVDTASLTESHDDDSDDELDHKLRFNREEIMSLKAQAIERHEAFLKSLERLVIEDPNGKSREDLDTVIFTARTESATHQIALERFFAMAKNLRALADMTSKFSDVVRIKNDLVSDCMNDINDLLSASNGMLRQLPQATHENMDGAIEELGYQIEMSIQSLSYYYQNMEDEHFGNIDSNDGCLRALKRVEDILGFTGAESNQTLKITQPADIAMEESGHDRSDNEQQLLQPPQDGKDDESTESLRLKYHDAEDEIKAALRKADANLKRSRAWHRQKKEMYLANSPVTHADVLSKLAQVKRDTEVAEAMSKKVVP